MTTQRETSYVDWIPVEATYETGGVAVLRRMKVKVGR